jgi:hypothetical protein
MMNDLSALADAHQEKKPTTAPGKIATGPGSGPQRGRRQSSSAPVMAAARVRKLPTPPSIAKIWGLALIGICFLLLGLLALTPSFFPASWQKVPQMGHSLSAFLLGLGFFTVAVSRGYSRRSYEIEKMKDPKDPQVWKIPLLAVQGLVLYIISFYLLGIAFHKWPAIHSQVALTFFFLVFLLYVLWYVLAYVVNRVPGQASRLLSMASSGLAALCLIYWLSQSIFLAAVIGFFALVCALVSVMTASQASYPSKFWGVFLLLTVLLILPAAIGLLPIHKNTVLLRDLAPAYQGLDGVTGALTYSPDGRTRALAQKVGKTWNLVLLQGGEEASPALSVPAGDEAFRPVFINGGRSLVCDFQVGSARNLYLVDSISGRTAPITREGIFPTGEGSPWSEASGRFLYTIQDGNNFEIRSVSPDQPLKPVIYQRDDKPFRSPSWFENGKKIAWVGGSLEDLSVYLKDLKENKTVLLAQAHDTVENSGFTPEGSEALEKISGKINIKLAPQGPGLTRINSVLPSPDDFRLLYSIRRGKVSELWAVLPDGTKASRIYQTDGEISQITWTPDGQQVVFEENVPGYHHFFLGSIPNIQILDVNVGTHSTLILPQVEQRSPALSPDGVKVAFLGSSGLWYPSLSSRSSLWVSVLR